ncbi:hypothetical protein L332_07355 [Agrococcus pavilionensis RW1]|uniref:Xylulokinase n=1 Tax=Agrococcus pavilionensis RW1 TaxID=1330458 RepID=U1LB24_9MICO|nr:FGGY family carbohydrate kinase [Agrococcus pavilionensis]ERG64268.1 hypothetical protein L332_07355 [Agrococcus pavilionensis RW1]
MTVHLGIDLGTSSVKCVLLSESGEVTAASQVAYGIDRPHPGWAEQDPELWWSATVDAVREVLVRGGALPSSIGLSGQMHGIVLLDERGLPVRPAIIWPDARTRAEAELWRTAVGDAQVTSRCGMPIASGLAGLSLTWLSKHEPAALAAASSVLQPKDWIRFRLTGALALEPTDACATLLFSIVDEQPVPELLALAGVSREQLPPMMATQSVAGEVTRRAADATGLRPGTPVAAGGGDQAMAAIALGLDRPERAAISISSSGTAVVPLELGTRSIATLSRTHHVIAGAHPGSRMAMGVVLAAGLATRWLAEDLLQGLASEGELLEAADAILPGSEGLTANPHLGGLRTPVVDGRPQGAFLGLGFHHRPAHLMRAVVDGVALSLAQSVLATPARSPVKEIVLSGGGSRFAVWHRAIADASGLPVVLSADVDHSPLGAALVGAIAAGQPVDFDSGARIRGRVEPDPVRAAAYRRVAATAAGCGAQPMVSLDTPPISEVTSA